MENYIATGIIVGLSISIVVMAIVIGVLVKRNKKEDAGDNVTAIEIASNDCIVIDQDSICLYRNIIEPAPERAKREKETITFKAGTEKRLTVIN